MLYLNPPFPIIDGVSFFPDHQDPLQFYYLPMMPHLTVLKDSKSGEQIPQIQVIKYRGDAGNGGFLNFDCNVGIDPAQLDDLASQLRQLQKLKDHPRLSPVPIVDGAVRMMLFGAETSEPPKPPGASSGGGGGTATATRPIMTSTTGTRFVTKIDQAAKPALYGDNQAAFSVALDQDGVVILEAALRGEMSPIGVVYELQYLGLRPAYNVHLSIDWDRVQKRMDEEYTANVLFFSSDIDKTVDQLIESRVIKLDTDTFVAEDDSSAAGVLSRRDQAINEVREMITDAFFKPSVDPASSGKDGWDRAINVATRVSQMAVTGGMASLASFGYRKLDYTRIDKKKLDVNISERTTVTRAIYPQGHLSGLFRVLAGKDLSKYMIDVDLADPWFQKRRVTAISRADFDDDSISSIDVHLDYAGQPQNTLLTPQQAQAPLAWSSQVVGGAMKRDVGVQYTVNFSSVDDLQRPQSVVSPKSTIDDDYLEVKPRDLYTIVHIPVVTLDVPWDRFAHVRVLLNYQDAANKIAFHRTLVMTKDKPEQTQRLFLLDRTKASFTYQLIYHTIDGFDVEMPAVTTDDPQIFLRDPFPSKRTLDVVCVVDWNRVANVFVDVSYTDPAHSVDTGDSFQFSPTDAVPKRFSVELQDPTHRIVAYDVTIVFKDNRVVQVPRSYTLDRRIMIRSDMNGHRVVQLRPGDGDFAAAQIKQINVQTRYVDAGAGLSYAANAVFASPKDRSTFEFDYVDPTKTQYEYATSTLYTNGLSKSTDWRPSANDELVVALGGA